MQVKNIRWNRALATGLIAISLPLAASNAFAQKKHDGEHDHCAMAEADGGAAMHRGPEHHRPGGFGPMFGGLGDHLPPFLHGIELSEAQRDKIFELQHAQAPRQREHMKALQQSMAALRALSGTDNFDVKQARLLADKHAKELSDVIVMHAESAAKIRALLTPEQKTQADEAKARFEQEHKPGQRHGFRPSCDS